MDQSYSESDVSLSPTKIFDRLQMLRQLQIMQRGKLQKHRLQYQDSPEMSSNITEIVSHFSNSTSYNTFRSLLQSSQDVHSEHNSCLEASISPRKKVVQDFIEGVSALNLSQESAFLTNSPVSTRSKTPTMATIHSNDVLATTNKYDNFFPKEIREMQPIVKKQISLDEMPILSPKKDFEELVIEKLKSVKNTKNKSPQNVSQSQPKIKKPFLRRGAGMSRFGIQKNKLVIQNTNALPWRKTVTSIKPVKPPQNETVPDELAKKTNEKKKSVNVQIIVTKPIVKSPIALNEEYEVSNTRLSPVINEPSQKEYVHSSNMNLRETNNTVNSKPSSFKTHGILNGKHPLKTSKGQTWATVLTKEQDNFLQQLKQSDYYKNFVSPVKSSISDTSPNFTPLKIRQDRELAEQKMFELLENKVTHESFNLNNSFFKRFLMKNDLEYSGESTPLVLKRCLYDNPSLLNLHHEDSNRNRNISCCDGESCSYLTEGIETCSSVSTCCSCKKDDPISEEHGYCNEMKKENNTGMTKDEGNQEHNSKENVKCPDDIVKKDESSNIDMAEMNAKLIATSELLKDRLRELEDEIETFRKENANLTKLRDELDVERQRFYEEKAIFDQKFNEEKILSEYYLAEEREKLNKQKQTYDRYVREMRGRLSKKDKDEVINLKKEITELKDEIKNKDARSTSTIARLRNQLKIIEKERKTLHDEIEKLKKENRRIQHSNDITRRLTNLKYLQQINKKLAHMSSKDIQSESDAASNQKYTAFEIERQSRNKNTQPLPSSRRRAKSVPNLNVTSRYAKYFSKKDSASDKDTDNLRRLVTSIESDSEDNDKNEDFNDSHIMNNNDSDEENNLEKIYNERFQSFSTSNNHQNITSNLKHDGKFNENNGFFIQKSNSINRSLNKSSKTSISPYQTNSSEISPNISKSPVSIPSYRSYRSASSPENVAKLPDKHDTVNQQNDHNVDQSSNRLSVNQRAETIINKDMYSDKSMIPSPEPSSSRTSLTKTNLNPIEMKKPDGSRELRFPNGNVKHISADGKYTKFIYYNGDVKENFYDEGRIKYFYAETKTYHTTHADGLEVLEFSDGQVEKRYKDGSSEIRLPNGSVRYYDPKNEYVREEWRFPDGAALTVSATGEQRIVFTNGQIEVHAKDHKRREFPDGTVKLVYNDGTSETRYASGRVRIKDKHDGVFKLLAILRSPPPAEGIMSLLSGLESNNITSK